MIDFASLVLGPCMDVFARPIIVIPLVSQPRQPAYTARGIWSSKPVDIQLEDGILSTQEHTLGLKIADFTILPKQGDRVDIPLDGNAPAIGIFLVEDADDDGQGGVVLSLKAVTP